MATCALCGDAFTVRRRRTHVCTRCAGACSQRPAEERFELYVDRSPGYGLGDCWRWTGPSLSAGIPELTVEGRTVSAVRYAWERAYGPLPKGARLANRCGYRCPNPDHWDVFRPGAWLHRAARLSCPTPT